MVVSGWQTYDNKGRVVVAYGVVRFDTLLTTYELVDDEGTDTLPITELDSAFLLAGAFVWALRRSR